MRRAANVDFLLIAVLGPLWLALAIIHAGLSLEGRIFWVPVFFSQSDGVYPEVVGFWSAADEEDQHLKPADRVVAVEARTMRGASPAQVVLAIYDAAADDREVLVRVLRGGRELGVAVRLRAIPYRWRSAAIAAAMAAVGFGALWRGRGRRETRALALATLAYSFHWLLLIGGPPAITRAGLILFFVTGAIFQPLALAVPMVFPVERAVRHRVLWHTRWLFVAIAPFMSSMMLGFPLPGHLGAFLLMVTNATFAGAFLLLVARAWVGASALSRRQIKWVLLGCYVGLIPVLMSAIVASLSSQRWWIYETSLLATIAIPACLLIAMLRYDFMDVDRLITASATLTILVALVGAPLPTIVPAVAEWAARATSLDADYFATAMVLLLLIAARWAEGVLRPWIERVVFRQTKEHEAGLRTLREELERSESPTQLLLGLGSGLCDVMAVERAVVYAATGSQFSPVFGHGLRFPGSLPSLPSTGELAEWIGGLGASRGLVSHREPWRLLKPDGVERALLLSLDASAVVPFQRDRDLAGFAVLGFKRSGDVFTPTELAHIDVLAERVGSVLRGFERERVVREERELTRRMLAYAPEPIVARLREGRAADPGEREVTVLFVDVRGSSQFAEQSSGSELFQLVDAFTRAAAGIIRGRGGTVVEFQGDCLMAAFGALGEGGSKERAGLAAGLEIVQRIEGADFQQLARGALRVGVGIATGVDFVGEIDCIERSVWTVLGNTSNLAARLEGEVAKTLGASIVLDEATFVGAGLPQGFIRHDGVAIRGRVSSFRVYARTL